MGNQGNSLGSRAGGTHNHLSSPPKRGEEWAHTQHLDSHVLVADSDSSFYIYSLQNCVEAKYKPNTIKPQSTS